MPQVEFSEEERVSPSGTGNPVAGQGRLVRLIVRMRLARDPKGAAAVLLFAAALATFIAVAIFSSALP